MIFRHELERAAADMRVALNDVSSKLAKLADGDLRKAAFKDRMAALEEILAEVCGLERIAARRDAALPSFEAWVSGKPTYAATRTGTMRDYGVPLMVATKGGGERGDELTALEMPQQQEPAIDPAKNVADVGLVRRHQGRQP